LAESMGTKLVLVRAILKAMKLAVQMDKLKAEK
jgi:hypothetical protein